MTRFLVRPRSEWSDRLRRPCVCTLALHCSQICGILWSGQEWHQTFITGDLQQAFLQIGLKTCDRDAFRFLFNINGREEYFRFSSLPFGAEASPFVLGTTLLYHYDQQPNSYEDTLESFKNNTYVDNLVVISKNLASLGLKQQKFWNRGSSQYTSGNQTSMY